ncbi:hypothetical protein, partial [Vibrio cholerae]|uniref:hypothetical protein n=1 Tax=Vibrio cholerae TaxID=666 RepID=UPI00308042EC
MTIDKQPESVSSVMKTFGILKAQSLAFSEIRLRPIFAFLNNIGRKRRGLTTSHGVVINGL